MTTQHRKHARPSRAAAKDKTAPDASQDGVGRPGRPYPPAAERMRIFEILAGIPVDARTSQDWYALGAMLAHEGFLEKNHDKVKAGIEALRRSTAFARPAREAQLELDWVVALHARHWPNVGI